MKPARKPKSQRKRSHKDTVAKIADENRIHFEKLDAKRANAPQQSEDDLIGEEKRGDSFTPTPSPEQLPKYSRVLDIRSYSKNRGRQNSFSPYECIAVGIILAVIIVAGCLVYALLGSGSKASQDKVQISKPELEQITPAPVQYEAHTENETTHSASRWTPSADGYTWFAASDTEKLALCKALASASRYGVSASTFYDALNTFYNTSDSEVLRVSIEFSAQYVEQANNPKNYR